MSSIPTRFELLLMAFFAFLPSSALADPGLPFHAGQLVCEGDRALVQVVSAEYLDEVTFPPLPEEIPAFTATAQNDDHCILSNGHEVRVKFGQPPHTWWGMCGDADNTFISMWVDRRKVLSRHWALRACFGERDDADVIYLDGQRLLLCQTNEAVRDEGQSPPAGCRDESERLQTALIDTVEYPQNGSKPIPVGQVSVLWAKDAEFCREFVAPPKKEGWYDEAVTFANNPGSRHFQEFFKAETWGRSDDWLAHPAEKIVKPDDASKVEFEELHWKNSDTLASTPLFSFAVVDFDNDGTPNFVLKYSGRSRVDFGERYFISDTASTPDLLDAAKAAPNLSTPLTAEQVQQKFMLGFEFKGVDEPSESRMLQMAFTKEGKTLVLASKPYDQSENAAEIYLALPDGGRELLCKFRIERENY